MRQIVYISDNERRIAKELARFLPNQPALVAYLDQAIRRNRGTVFTARKIGELLVEELPRLPVGHDVVDRLAVHANESAMGVLGPELIRQQPNALFNLVVLLIRLTAQIKDVPGDINLREFAALYQQGMHPFPPGSNIDDGDLETFMRIYLCALAMLLGIELDPRLHDKRVPG